MPRDASLKSSTPPSSTPPLTKLTAHCDPRRLFVYGDAWNSKIGLPTLVRNLNLYMYTWYLSPSKFPPPV